MTARLDRFYRTHERVMWDFTAIPWDRIQRHLIRETDLMAIRGAMLIESHNPVYTQVLLNYFRHDQEMAAFTVLWSYEELKHYAVLRAWLEATDLVDVFALEQELEVTRAGDWGETESKFTPVQWFTYTMLQEEITGLFYKRFASRVAEPVLKDILLLVAKDEYRHCQWYLEKAQELLAKDKKLMDQVDEILINFEMPGPTFIREFEEKYAEEMRVAVSPDVTALGEVLNKISKLTGRFHLLKVATSREYMRRLRDDWGFDPKQAISLIRL